MKKIIAVVAVICILASMAFVVVVPTTNITVSVERFGVYFAHVTIIADGACTVYYDCGGLEPYFAMGDGTVRQEQIVFTEAGAAVLACRIHTMSGVIVAVTETGKTAMTEYDFMALIEIEDVDEGVQDDKTIQ